MGIMEQRQQAAIDALKIGEVDKVLYCFKIGRQRCIVFHKIKELIAKKCIVSDDVIKQRIEFWGLYLDQSNTLWKKSWFKKGMKYGARH